MAQTANYRRRRNWYLIRHRSHSFFSSQWAGGVVLVVFAIVAMVLANTEATKHIYHHILTTDIGFEFGSWNFTMNIEQWINDALMVVFFFVVGLEIKREIIAGQLSNIKQAALPIAAAIGGMILPAAIYFALNAGTEYESGWGIPMATDIAFAIGILSLLGKKVPLSLKIFLTALAIVDDLGAILVIAIFYTSQIDITLLLIGAVILAMLCLFNKWGVKTVAMYIIPGIALWFLFLNSGVHATIAGVLLAMTIPAKPRFSKKYFTYKVRYFLEDFKFHDKAKQEVISNESQHHDLCRVKLIANAAISPTQRMEHALNPFVTFLIMPVFALANAGVEIVSIADLQVLENTQGLGIFLGLVVGKPLGIFMFCLLAVKLGWAVMPEGSTWKTLFAVGCLGGIGFTMSIFIDTLAFAGTRYVDTGKIAILIASFAAAIVGALVINILAKKGK